MRVSDDVLGLTAGDPDRVWAIDAVQARSIFEELIALRADHLRVASLVAEVERQAAEIASLRAELARLREEPPSGWPGDPTM